MDGLAICAGAKSRANTPLEKMLTGQDRESHPSECLFDSP